MIPTLASEVGLGHGACASVPLDLLHTLNRSRSAHVGKEAAEDFVGMAGRELVLQRLAC